MDQMYLKVFADWNIFLTPPLLTHSGSLLYRAMVSYDLLPRPQTHLKTRFISLTHVDTMMAPLYLQQRWLLCLQGNMSSLCILTCLPFTECVSVIKVVPNMEFNVLMWDLSFLWFYPKLKYRGLQATCVIAFFFKNTVGLSTKINWNYQLRQLWCVQNPTWFCPATPTVTSWLCSMILY